MSIFERFRHKPEQSKPNDYSDLAKLRPWQQSDGLPTQTPAEFVAERTQKQRDKIDRARRRVDMAHEAVAQPDISPEQAELRQRSIEQAEQDVSQAQIKHIEAKLRARDELVWRQELEEARKDPAKAAIMERNLNEMRRQEAERTAAAEPQPAAQDPDRDASEPAKIGGFAILELLITMAVVALMAWAVMSYINNPARQQTSQNPVNRANQLNDTVTNRAQNTNTQQNAGY